MKRIFLFFLFFSISFSVFSQEAKQITISFIPTIDNKIVIIDNETNIDSSQLFTINITKLKFYVSHLNFYKNDKLIWQDKTPAFLMDAENKLNITLTVPQNIMFDKLQFGLGIDSATNVSGALGGDLDPLKGMYWTWQSGYVNCKLEGTIPHKNNNIQKFEYHLGGYAGENNSYNTVSLEVANSSNINISFDIGKFLNNINVGAHPNIMSPGKIAVDCSRILTSCFGLQ